MPVVDELVTLLGLEADPAAKGEAKSFEAALEGVRNVALAAGAALVTLAGGTFALSKKFASSADESGKFAESVGIGVQKLEELEFASDRVGGSASDLRGDLEGLAQRFGSANTGIDALIKQFDGLTDIQAKLAGSSFGISESTIRLLRRGADGIADMRAEFRALGGGLPEEATVRAEEFNHQWLNLMASVRGVTNIVQTSLLPAFSGSTQALRQFLVSNRKLIAGGLTTFITGVLNGFSDFGKILNAIEGYLRPLIGGLDSLVGSLETVDTIANLVTGTLALLALLLLPIAIKIALITAAAVVLGVAIDDLLTFIKGGDSVIGRFFDSFEARFPALVTLLRYVASVFKEVFGAIVEGAGLVGDAIANAFPDLEKMLKRLGEMLSIKGRIVGALDLINSGAELLGFGAPGASAPAPTLAPVPASTVNNTSNSSNVRGGTTTINIHGAGDPRGVAAEVVRKSGLGGTLQILSPGQRAPRSG